MSQLKTNPETLPLVVEHLTPLDLVRVEKSHHPIGFFASAAKKPETSRTVIQIFRRPDGQKIHANAVIEGVPSLGLRPPRTATNIWPS
jgi:hypothetical protein